MYKIATNLLLNREKNDAFYKPMDFSAFRNSDYGYGRMTVFNATHLYFEQVWNRFDIEFVRDRLCFNYLIRIKC